MKKIYNILILVTCLIVILSSPGFTLTYDNSGTLLGIFSGNDNVLSDVYSNIINSPSYTGPTFTLTDFEFYAKVDEPAVTTTEGTGTLSVTYTDGRQSGTWTSGDPLNFYSLKASNKYALYWENPSSSTGTWSTIDLLNTGHNGETLTLSHISGYTASPVPEPTTMLLLGSGLIGLAGVGRKKFKK